MKKELLTIGTTCAMTFPIVSVISCGDKVKKVQDDNKEKQDDNKQYSFEKDLKKISDPTSTKNLGSLSSSISIREDKTIVTPSQLESLISIDLMALLLFIH